MERGRPIFRQNFTCSALLENNEKTDRIRDYHPLWFAFPKRFCFSFHYYWPGPCSLATTKGVSLISFPPGTKMFQFSGFASVCYGFTNRYLIRGGFSHSDISGSSAFWQLTRAYRSLTRPSSPPCAKAFTKRPYLLFNPYAQR